MSRYALGQQEPLLRVPGARNGLWRAVLIAGTDRVDDGAWRHRAAIGQHVGTCKAEGCGAPMLAGPDPPDTTATPTTYTATCTRCGKTAAAHGPAPRQKKIRRR